MTRTAVRAKEGPAAAPVGSRPEDAIENTGVTVAAGVAVAASLAGAWIAGGSSGLVSTSLQNALVWLCAGTTLAALWPSRPQPAGRWGLLAAGLAWLAWTTAHDYAPATVLATALLPAAFSVMHDGWHGRAMRITAVAIGVFGVYRVTYTAIPLVWKTANAAGWALGWLAGSVTNRPLEIGASFAGIDFLVLMLVFWACWSAATPTPRRTRTALGAAAILAAHVSFLIVLSYSVDLAAMLPPAPPPPASDLEQTPLWSWSESLRSLFPWNVPAVAVAAHALVAALMFRWGVGAPGEGLCLPNRLSQKRPEAAELLLPVFLAVLTPMALMLTPTQPDLSGKTIVAFEKGYLNWAKPRHEAYGQDAAGLFGMLPTFVESLGGKMILSPDLSDADLAKADVLLLIHPDRPWAPQQQARIWDYVRGGGSLLLAAETQVHRDGSDSSFPELLRSTSIEVRYDAAYSETGNWRQSLEPSTHPAACGLGDRRDRFGISAGSTIGTRLAGWPILIGRWGWAEPGSDTVSSGALARYEPGKPLGDLVLAAEQNLGKGRVVVLGDTWCLTNQGTVNSFGFTGRLLGYLANKTGSPFSWWRQSLGLLGCLAMAVLLLRQPNVAYAAVVAVAMGGCMLLIGSHNESVSRVLPDGRKHSPNNVAYIDASHLERHGGVNWQDDGVTGLALNLMRNGYIPFLMPELSRPRLERAGVLFSIAPAREFSESQQELLHEWVSGGGRLICTVGGEDVEGSRGLLEKFGFRVPGSPVPPSELVREPAPMGCILGYDETTKQTNAWFFAAWPVECDDSGALVNSRGREGRPVVITRSVGTGTITVIGDSKFALNRSVERANGQAIYGGYHNAHFWRWYFSGFSGGEVWSPPPTEAPGANTTTDESVGKEEKQ